MKYSNEAGTFVAAWRETPGTDPYDLTNVNQNEFLVVWHEKSISYRHIVGRRVSVDGIFVGGPIEISSGTYDRIQPQANYDEYNKRYLVVWMYDAGGTGTNYEIWGRYVQPDGSQPDPEFKIFSWANRSFWSPKIAFNKNYDNLTQLVVWNALDSQTGQFSDIAGAFISGNGLVTPIPLITTANNPHQVNIVSCSVCTKFMVAWRHMNSGNNGDIYGAFLDPLTGAVINPPGIFIVSDNPQDQNFPCVATDDINRFVVVWQNTYSATDRDILGQYIDDQGTRLGGNFSVAVTSDDESNPDVLSLNYGNIWAVWQRKTATGEAIWAAFWRFVETSIKPFEVSSNPFWSNETPVVGYSWTKNPNMEMPFPIPIIVYTGDSMGDPTVFQNIYGRILQLNHVYLPLLLKY